MAEKSGEFFEVKYHFSEEYSEKYEYSDRLLTILNYLDKA